MAIFVFGPDELPGHKAGTARLLNRAVANCARPGLGWPRARAARG
ncbi:hypothetical protein [Streptomyces sp. NPDC050485]